ncbi:hypothetical protein [Sandaracinobacteroides saxicola]|nr:hypothetical protein [Sandaracinobacteroides saxicola]
MAPQTRTPFRRSARQPSDNWFFGLLVVMPVGLSSAWLWNLAS